MAETLNKASDPSQRFMGLAHLKEEGAPMHPDDCFIHCGCAKCEDRWQRQLKAYNDHLAKKKKRGAKA